MTLVSCTYDINLTTCYFWRCCKCWLLCFLQNVKIGKAHNNFYTSRIYLKGSRTTLPYEVKNMLGTFTLWSLLNWFFLWPRAIRGDELNHSWRDSICGGCSPHNKASTWRVLSSLVLRLAPASSWSWHPAHREVSTSLIMELAPAL